MRTRGLRRSRDTAGFRAQCVAHSKEGQVACSMNARGPVSQALFRHSGDNLSK